MTNAEQLKNSFNAFAVRIQKNEDIQDLLEHDQDAKVMAKQAEGFRKILLKMAEVDANFLQENDLMEGVMKWIEVRREH